MLLHRKSKDLKEPLINDNWEKKRQLDDLESIEENPDDEEEEWGLYVANSEPRLKYSIEYGKEIGFSRALAVGVYIFFILGTTLISWSGVPFLTLYYLYRSYILPVEY